jgi:hypothetical protein
LIIIHKVKNEGNFSREHRRLPPILNPKTTARAEGGDMVLCVFGIAEFGRIYFLCGETKILVLIIIHRYMALYIELHKNK